MTKNKLYTLLAIACFFGFAWIGFTVFAGKKLDQLGIRACMFKSVTSYPCPSCGTTRSVKMLLLDGDLCGAAMMNPIGIVVALIMVLSPVWILFDLIANKQTLFETYQKAEKIIVTRRVAIALALLIILNWIWNINKHL